MSSKGDIMSFRLLGNVFFFLSLTPLSVKLHNKNILALCFSRGGTFRACISSLITTYSAGSFETPLVRD